MLTTVIAFIVALGVLIVVHEWGHYRVAVACGVKVLRFSIGFGREVAGFTDSRGTRWKFGWLPLGGYVKFAGDMNPASQPSSEWLALPAHERAQTFQAKPLWQRAIIVAAGPIMNFIVAIVILGAFAVAFGQNTTPAVIGTVVPGSPAASAGLQAGDRITALGGREIDDFNDMFYYTVMRPGEAVTIDYERGGTPQQVEAVIGERTLKDRFGNVSRRGMLGIGPGEPVLEPVPLWRAPIVGITRTWDIVGTTVDGLKQMILGRVPISELGGPIKIAQISGQSLAMGPLDLVGLIALISINLGFINLLPIPVLDGGHLLFYAVEAVRRRPVEPQVMEWAFRGGMIAILALMLFVTLNDLGAFGLWSNLAGLIG